ncbi:GNAT family N-acetyltransferase [Lutibaculum baratangense]|uniref:Uncharacterized protein n=1 Tax=Lutibaculum baratangense AMV1 TaxID=631454 RepID=V4RB89_9HYPH|nr:GNAT family N-acetyltransferase [Lutibaculum baratangense]ESR22674.1 hypothetical protein N177_3811 [Lutibaculum baratangense AMV1]
MAIDIIRRDDGSAGDYTASVDGARAGALTYRRTGRWLTVTHTEALPAFRGQGIAYALVERLAADARAEGSRIVPLCWYAREKLNENPAWQDLVEGR